MGFLAPWYLLLAAAAGVPLLLHLLRRRIGTRVEFPAARYLARAEQEASARLRLRNWLLMALRMLAVLLLALAAARPATRWRAAGRGPSAVAVVLDNSLSTSVVADGRPVLDALRERAAAVVAAARATDRVWLVTADGRVTGGTTDAVLRALDRVTPLAGAGDLPGAVRRGAEAARAAAMGAAGVVVVTDGQATAWPTPADAGNTLVVLLPLGGAAPRNRAVLSAAPRPARWAPGGAVVATLLSPDSVAWRVDVGGASAARGIAGPDDAVRAVLRPAARGWLAGEVRLDPDELRGDDARWFAVAVGEPPHVRADPSAGPFVGTALGALADAGRIAPGAGGRTVTVAEPVAGVALPALLVAPSDPSRLGAANQALERLGVPWRFGAARTGDVALRGPALDTAARATAARRYALLPRGAAVGDTLVAAGGEPWAVAGDGWVVVASPLVPEATSLPLRAAFVPWLGSVLGERLALDAPGTVVEAAPGRVVSIPPGVDALLAPDGTRRAVGGASLSAPDRPGVYLWLRNGARTGALVVNPEAEESRLARSSEAALRGRVRAREVVVERSADAATAAAYGGGGRRPIGGPLLAAAILVLVAESLAVRDARRRPHPGAARVA